MHALARWTGRYFHYGWIVVAVCSVQLIAVASLRAAPGVLILPLQASFGWTNAAIASAMSASLLLFGLLGPFAAAVMQQIGVRRLVLAALATLVIATTSSLAMSEPWHLWATWGVMTGVGTGMVGAVFSAVIASRWFATRRGLVLGILTASMSAGQLIFLPLLAALADGGGWHAVVIAVAITLAAVIPLIFVLLPNAPRDLNLAPYGATAMETAGEPRTSNPVAVAFTTLWRGMRHGSFWLLAGSFFVCGLSTNGFVGVHMIAACVDQGMTAVTGAALLATMGIFNMAGAALSGWLSDRWDNRWLLFWYYATRGASLLFLPYSGFSLYGLSLFAIFYGLDWIATVPATVRLTTDVFGKRDAPILYGWIFVAHQFGAAIAASGAGIIRTSLDRYLEAFIVAGLACLIAALFSLGIGRRQRADLKPALAS